MRASTRGNMAVSWRKGVMRPRRGGGSRSCPRPGWVLLETVIASGLLILGLAVIGAQVQDAYGSIREMRLRLRAMALVEMKLAELELGLVELDTIDEVVEEEYGPRFPEFGWRLITEETGLDGMFLLTLEVLHLPKDPEDVEDYQEGNFDFDIAQSVYTVHVLRPAPRPVNLGEEFGLDEEEFIELSEKLGDLGIEGLDAKTFDPRILATVDMEELLKVLPLLADVFGIDIEGLAGSLPPELLDALKEGGLLEEGAEEGGGKEPES